jgi:hypothetical protein
VDYCTLFKIRFDFTNDRHLARKVATVLRYLEVTNITITVDNTIADKVVDTTKPRVVHHTVSNFINNMFSFMYSFVILPVHVRNSNYSSYFINTE